MKVSATRMVHLADGDCLLETFDFRSKFALADFVRWIAERLNIAVYNCEIQNGIETARFDWEDSTFEIAWNEESGCHVKVEATLEPNLRKLQAVLAK